jgi:TonB family protein
MLLENSRYNAARQMRLRATIGAVLTIVSVVTLTGRACLAAQESGLTDDGPRFSSDYEVKISNGSTLVRRKGSSEWTESTKLGEPIAIGLIDGEQKIYIATKVISPPKAMHQVDPEYPPALSRDRQPGRVSLHVVVDGHGKVRYEKPGFSSGPAFTEAAIAAVRQWTFQPARLEGQPAAVLIVVQVYFR